MFRATLLLLIAMVFCYCGGESTDNNVQEVSQNSETTNTPEEAVPAKMHFESSHEAPYCKLWVTKFAVEVEDIKDYKGRWFDLKCDGTFESGQWEEKTNYGQWNIEKDKNIINLLFNSPENIPARWEIQGAGGGGRIIWKGNIYGNEKGYQVIMESENFKPAAGSF